MVACHTLIPKILTYGGMPYLNTKNFNVCWIFFFKVAFDGAGIVEVYIFLQITQLLCDILMCKHKTHKPGTIFWHRGCMITVTTLELKMNDSFKNKLGFWLLKPTSSVVVFKKTIIKSFQAAFRPL